MMIVLQRRRRTVSQMLFAKRTGTTASMTRVQAKRLATVRSRRVGVSRRLIQRLMERRMLLAAAYDQSGSGVT
jgi:hypothetical protein